MRHAEWATFLADGEIYALPVADVYEVLMDQRVLPVPLAPRHVLGLMNLRGHIVPAVDIRRLLGLLSWENRGGRIVAVAGMSMLGTSRWQGEAHFVVVRCAGERVALVVDDVGDVLELDEHGWRPAPETLPAEQLELVDGMFMQGKQVVLRVRAEGIAHMMGVTVPVA